MRNQTSFRLTTTLLPTDLVAKTTTVINKVDEDGNKFYPTFTEETVVLTNDDRTIMETARAICENGVLTFTKRGLSDDQSEEQIENRKLTRNPGSLCFITAGAGDWIDKDDDITWTGTQTYTGTAVYEGLLTTKKGVKYPSFSSVEALEEYGTPYAGMFAVVEDTGELYRYNANTRTWAMVSNNEAGQYIIRESDTKPEPGTADNILTVSPALRGIYLGTREVIRNQYVDVLVVGGGGGGGGAISTGTSLGGSVSAGGGGGGGGVEYIKKLSLNSAEISVEVGFGGLGVDMSKGLEGGNSKFGDIIAIGGGGGGNGGASNYSGGNGGNGGGGGQAWNNNGIGGIGISSSSTPGNSGGNGHVYTDYGTSVGGGQGGSAYIRGISGEDHRELPTKANIGLTYNIGGDVVNVSNGGGGGYSSYISSSSYEIIKGETVASIGSGGGGAAYIRDTGSISSTKGTDGNAGIVKVAYPVDGSYGFTQATGGVVTTNTYLGKQYKIHTFTANGTFTIIS